MTEDKLNALKDLPSPPPRTEAKAAALAAAMAAFDAGAENIADEPQGNGGCASLKHVSQPKMRQTMRAPTNYKIAASIAVLAVAVPMALYVAGLHNSFESVEGVADEFAQSPPTKTVRVDDLAKQPLKDAREEDGKPVALAPLGKVKKERLVQDAAPEPKADPQTVEKNVVGPSQQASRHDRAGAPTSNSPGQSEAEPNKQPIGTWAINLPAPPPSDRLTGAAKGEKPEAARQAQPVAGLSSSDEEKFAAPEPEENRDAFKTAASNPVKQVTAEPVSTFSIDVDTASYSFVRRALNAGRLPPKDAVRVEEMINYFPYSYPRPETAETPFQPTVTVVPAPWKPTNKLIHIAIKGYDLTERERPRANLVFLIDVSGSMEPADRLPLVKNAFRMLVEELKPDDTVGIVTYASGSGVALVPTKIAQKEKIFAAIDRLGAGGSTAGAQGITDAYGLAIAHFDKAGINRVILATDGDFNVGISNVEELKGFIERKREAGVFLSILGVGRGNYNDELMQVLAQNGNGTAAYVDTLNEARKVLVDEASSTLFPIAKDVKIQLEFNPAQVSEYRLIGYETRALRREDFNNDKVDAGDIGCGHTVTAIYEITPAGAPKLVDDLRYRTADPGAAAPAQDGEIGFLKLRYKLPNEDASKLITLPVTSALYKPEIAAAPEDVRFSVAVAAFGQLLRGTSHLQNYGLDDVLALAQTARGPDPYGYRAEFLNLLRLAKSARP
jgi:Ca-activated chloride channel family protein